MNLIYRPSSRQLLGGAALSALAVCSTSHAADTSTQIRFEHTDRCQFLSTNCRGSQDTLSVTFKSTTGETEYGVTRFNERDQNLFWDQRYRLGNIGHIHGQAQWNAQADGIKVYGTKQFYLGPQAGVSIGAYLGKLNASASADGRIDIHTKALRFDIPALQIPAIPQWGIGARNIPAQQINIDALSRTLIQDHTRATGSTPYAGITLDSGYSFPITPQLTGVFGKGTTIGFDGMWGTLNAGLMYSSNRLHNTRTPMGNVCEGRPAFPRSGFNIMANFCVRRDFKNPLYDAEYKKAGELGTRIGNRLSQAADRIESETGYRPSTPTYSAERVLDVLGIESPYQLQQSLQLSIAGRDGNFVYSLGVAQPVGKVKGKGRSVNFSVGYEYY